MEQPTVARRIVGGIKAALGLFFALPFVLFLLPLWFFYRWNEVRSGRPEPEAPWASIRLPSFFFSFSAVSSPSSSESAGRGDEPEVLASVNPVFSCRSPTDSSNELDKAARPCLDHVPPSTGGVALVTGGAHHIGAAICQDLARLGYRVAVLYYRSKVPAEVLVETIQAQGGKAKPFYLDQSDPDQIARLLHDVERAWGIPDLLVNNASLFLPTPLGETTWETLGLLCQVNLQGPVWLAMRVGERMRHRASKTGQGGQIIQLCDIWGERPLAGYSVYSATKAGLIMATRALAREMAPFVRVNAIAPGAVLSKGSVGEDPNFQKMLSRTPLAHHAGPESIQQAVRYLLTAQFVTGEILHVDGGRRLD